MARHPYGIHDFSPEWGFFIKEAGVTAWAVISEGIGADPSDLSGRNYSDLSSYGVTPIVRLNYSHHGEGTIPLPSHYEAFATRCFNFVAHSQGCRHWIIGNEPNWSIERPSGVSISPVSYADAYNRCRDAIRAISSNHQVIPAAIAPYNAETGSWIDYFEVMLQNLSGADGIAIHTYSRGVGPESIYSEARMNPPYEKYHNGFRAYRDFMAVIPEKFKNLPVYITETNQMQPWQDSNTGWVKEAYREVSSYSPNIHCLALYRWENYDQFGLKNKNGPIQDFKDALKMNMKQLEFDLHIPIVLGKGQGEVKWDDNLTKRGVLLQPASVPPGQTYWKLVEGKWLDTREAQTQYGPDHHILVDTLNESGARQTGVLLQVSWPSGSTRITSKGNNGYPWSADFAMDKSLNEYGITIADGIPSDTVSGIGMGKDGNSGIHTSTLLVFRKVKAGEDVGGRAMPPLVHPVSDPNYRRITQVFGANPSYYSQYKVDDVPLQGHNGVDFGTPVGVTIFAVDEGRVVEVADQGNKGYGQYVKLVHSWGESLYAHLSAQNVSVGQRVHAGAMVGWSGNTGNSTGPHLHFGLRIAPFNRKDGMGGYTNPLPYLGNSSVTESPKDIAAIVRAAAEEFGVDWRLLVSLVHAESSFNPKSINTNSGAKGLGNIMPSTWAEWGTRVGARDIFSAKDNARVTAAYLRWCIDMAGSVRKGLWAYVWGIGNVQRNSHLLPASVAEYATKIIHGSEVLKIVNP